MEKYFGILSSAQLDEMLPDVDRSSMGLERAGVRIDRMVHRLTGSPLGRGDWSVMRGLSVLDLGCGSDEFGRDGLFQPHLARLLTANGAQVTGVDLGQNVSSHEAEYKHLQEDIFARVMARDLPEVQGLRGTVCVWTSI